MRIKFQPGPHTQPACDMLAFPVFEDQAAALKTLDRTTRGLVGSVLASGEFKPELHRACLLHQPPGLKARRLLLIGGGKRKGEYTPARLRELAGVGIRRARKAHCRTVAFSIPSGLPLPQAFQAAAEGGLYANHEPDAFKTRDRKDQDVEELLLLSEARAAGSVADPAIRRGTIIGNATNLARSLVNEPGNVLTPARLAERAFSAGAAVGLEVKILEQEELEKLGMNALLAVGRGSEEPPRLILLRLPARKGRKGRNAPRLALVGKGVTFDSGGISLKPADKMEEMKADMAGGAAVLGAMLALAELGTSKDIIGLIPAVENLPSGKAVKPGDVVRSYLGKTVEIVNTDAEGRLILADSLAYARSLGATRLIDVATLTGACIVALGHINAGMLGTDEGMMRRLRRNVEVTGEKLWQLPLDRDYRKALDSDIADIKNSGPRWGGAITAAKFLQEFVEDTPWVHLDIAGMDLDSEGRPFAAKGATGFGVRTLVQLVI